MATKKPTKRAANVDPEPPNPRAEPGCFIVRGKAWFDEQGYMVIDEDGEVADDWELLRHENLLYDEDDFRNDGNPRVKAVPLYELRWCPIARKPKKPRKR